MKLKVRLLPLVIFSAALTLSLKVGTLWEDVRVSWSSPAVAEAKKTDTESDGKKAKAGSKVEEKSDPPEFDAATVTDSEIELLQKLAERRQKLERRENGLNLRESILSATERRIDSKVAELTKIQATIENLLKKHDVQQEAKLRSLVKIYENMKPKHAARIFDRLELTILLDVIERMRESKTAPIMANMAPARAKSVTSALVARRTLPSPRR